LREYNEKNVIVSLPEEFSQRIEKDLNTLVSGIPVILSSNFEFLIGTLVGNCQVSYIQAFDQLYDQMPSAQQIEEIHKVISSRKSQFEQGVSAFLEENNIK
jgi:hypothetical protein